MGLYEQIREVAKSKGYSINKLEQELGFARSSINKFNKNKPSIDKLQQIADLLGVSVDYLTTRNEANEPILNARDERDIKKDLDSLMEKLTNKEYGPAAFDGNDIPDADCEMFAGQIELMLRRLKAIHKNEKQHKPPKNSISYYLNAAQARTGTEPTPEGQDHDDAIMDDDKEWE